MSIGLTGTAVEEFSAWHERGAEGQRYRRLIPMRHPQPGEQYAFEVNLDKCSGCKACVVACHNLNGLDSNESWRDVGMLTSNTQPYLQTVTTACHHCEEPGCADGCPVLAYQKDERTGIVRHLDDQCIGCSYCILKCPYDVPKFNKKRNIVRKCDLCQGRLAAGEAPACVQACPTGAITVRIVRTGQEPTEEAMLPGAFPSRYTRPTTRYISSRPIPAQAISSTAGELRLEEGHWPLVVMLVLTQWSTGLFVLSSWHADRTLLWLAFGLAAVGLAASGAHLGQPLKAWRVFLGWRRSWLSREVMAFGAFFPTALGAATGLIPPAWAALAGLLSVFCSIMVYVDTRRPLWSFPRTAAAFLGTTVVLGAAVIPGLGWVAAGTLAMKLWGELWLLRRANRTGQDALSVSARLRLGPASPVLGLRLACAVLGTVTLWSSPWIGLGFMALGELLERSLYFRTCPAPRMPGI